VLARVAEAFDLAPDAILDRSHPPAFRAAVYLLRRVCNLPLAQTAHLAGVSVSRVSRIQAQVERDPPSEALQRLLSGYGVEAQGR
jgi:hypothetical protein